MIQKDVHVEDLLTRVSLLIRLLEDQPMSHDIEALKLYVVREMWSEVDDVCTRGEHLNPEWIEPPVQKKCRRREQWG